MSTYSKNAKVLVRGKAQNRTALGIVHAYQTIYPDCTFDDLKKAFPASLYTESNTLDMFVVLEKIGKNNETEWVKDRYMIEEESIINFANGEKVALTKLWTKNSFANIVEKAKRYGIEVAEFTAADKGFGKRGGYTLEFLNGFIPPTAKTSKKWIIWIILILLLLLLLLLAGLRFFKPAPKVEIVEPVDTVEVVEVVELEPTALVEADEATVKASKEYKSVFFELGKTDLKADALEILNEIVADMKNDETLSLCVEGHASAEGSEQVNKKLSNKRANVAVDYLISQGISPKRLQSVAYGYSLALLSNNPSSASNRRVEFRIIKNSE